MQAQIIETTRCQSTRFPVDDLDKGWPAPELERIANLTRRSLGLPEREVFACTRQDSLESARVDVVRRHRQLISMRARRNCRLPERLAEAHDTSLDDLGT